MIALDSAVWFAVSGAFGIKLLEIAELYKVPILKRPDLKDWLYWVPFLIIPILGGGLAHAYVTTGMVLSPILAIHVGASAPITFRAMAQGSPFQGSTLPTEDDA